MNEKAYCLVDSFLFRYSTNERIPRRSLDATYFEISKLRISEAQNKHEQITIG